MNCRGSMRAKCKDTKIIWPRREKIRRQSGEGMRSKIGYCFRHQSKTEEYNLPLRIIVPSTAS
jgi:hypothetical protein